MKIDANIIVGFEIGVTVASVMWLAFWAALIAIYKKYGGK